MRLKAWEQRFLDKYVQWSKQEGKYKHDHFNPFKGFNWVAYVTLPNGKWDRFAGMSKKEMIPQILNSRLVRDEYRRMWFDELHGFDPEDKQRKLW